jgi:hypothetical protein
MTTGHELPVLQGGFIGPGMLAFAPDGLSAVSCDMDRTMAVWNAEPFLPARAPPVKLSMPQREAAWSDLALLDGRKAQTAMRSLTGDPDGTLEFLKSRLTAPLVPEAKRMQALIRALGSEHFSVRVAAARDLERHGDLARPAVKEALVSERDPERRRALETLLARLDDDLRPERLRERRAVEVLEKLATPAARAWLESVAIGPADTTLTREAAAAVARMRTRTH